MKTMSIVNATGYFSTGFLLGYFLINYNYLTFTIPSYDLADWQIALIGAFLPILFYPIRSIYEDWKVKNRLISLLCVELSNAKQILDQIIEKGTSKPDDPNIIIVTDEELLLRIPVDTMYYDNVDSETLAYTFNESQLIKLQKVYRKIIFFNKKAHSVLLGGRYERSLIESLNSEIISVIKILGREEVNAYE